MESGLSQFPNFSTRPNQPSLPPTQPDNRPVMQHVINASSAQPPDALQANASPFHPTVPTAVGGANQIAIAPVQSMHSTFASSPPSVTYMKTAVCVVSGPRGSRVVRVLIDDGANVSFVTNEVAEELGLPTTGTAVFACSGWRGLTGPSKQRRQVSCSLKGFFYGGPAIPLNFWVEDSPLCVPLPQRPLPASPLLQSLPLADDFRPGNVDILIGTDMIYNVVGVNQRRISPSLRAIETAFGWVIHGNQDSRQPPVKEPVYVHHVAAVPEPEVPTGVGKEPEEPLVMLRPRGNSDEDIPSSKDSATVSSPPESSQLPDNIIGPVKPRFPSDECHTFSAPRLLCKSPFSLERFVNICSAACHAVILLILICFTVSAGNNGFRETLFSPSVDQWVYVPTAFNSAVLRDPVVLPPAKLELTSCFTRVGIGPVLDGMIVACLSRNSHLEAVKPWMRLPRNCHMVC